MLVADYAKATDKFVLVIDNTKYHTLAADKKATVLAYYDSIIPEAEICLLYTSPSPRDGLLSRMPSSA